MKRVLSIQDISCLGKCSLTIALPVISACGVETVVLPTALLSTHSVFKDFTFKELSDQMKPITEHWKKEKIRFDAIATGYLGTESEIDAVLEIFKEFTASAASDMPARSGDPLRIVDPAFGDRGRLYSGFDMHYAKRNAELCASADVILPNITEACLMTDFEYREEYDETYIIHLMERLRAITDATILLTGVSLSDGMTGVYGWDADNQNYFSYQTPIIVAPSVTEAAAAPASDLSAAPAQSASFHGTGDLFSSTLVGARMRGLSWQESIELAAEMVSESIKKTLESTDPVWYGVDFEAAIPFLVSEIQKKAR